MTLAPLAINGRSLAAERPTVVELFTSEGCSSCPPADELLGELSRRPNVLALGFHVDYWDSLGWSDRFGLSYADARQSRYARNLGLSSVFTPQVIIDAERSLVGSDRNAVLRAIGGTREGIPIAIERQAETLTIDLGADTHAAAGADVLLLALVREAHTAISHGENGGRTLHEFNIVRSRYILGRWQGAAHRYAIPCEQLPADASAVAVMIQGPEQGPILGAASFTWR